MKSKESILMNYIVTKEIYKFLDANASNVKNVLKNKIKIKFNLSDKETDEIYSSWKAEYMRYKTC